MTDLCPYCDSLRIYVLCTETTTTATQVTTTARYQCHTCMRVWERALHVHGAAEIVDGIRIVCVD